MQAVRGSVRISRQKVRGIESQRSAESGYLFDGLTGAPLGLVGSAVPGVSGDNPPAFCPSLDPVAWSTGAFGLAGNVKGAATPVPSVAGKGGCVFSCAIDEDTPSTSTAAIMTTLITICFARGSCSLQNACRLVTPKR